MDGLFVSITPEGKLKRHLSVRNREVPLEDATVGNELILFVEERPQKTLALLDLYHSNDYSKSLHRTDRENSGSRLHQTPDAGNGHLIHLLLTHKNNLCTGLPSAEILLGNYLVFFLRQVSVTAMQAALISSRVSHRNN